MYDPSDHGRDRRIVVIDPTLGDPVRGHPYHLELGPPVCRAALAAGADVLLATHRDLARQDSGLDDLCVEPVFDEGVYWRWDGTEVPFQPSPLILDAEAVERRTQAFSMACAALFDRIGIAEGQIVYLPMVSEFHVLGLARFLGSRPEARRASWHAQFHFAVVQGPPAGEAMGTAQQQLGAATRQVLVQAFAACPGVPLFLYATNDRLSEQFRRLGVGDVRALPQPSRPEFQPLAPSLPGSRPLRISVAGALRRTKVAAFDAVLAGLQRRLAAGKVQLLLQVPPEHPVHPRQPDAWRTSRDPLVCAPYPLAPADYLDLVRGTDVGLLPYNPVVYEARLSGVLYEMRSAGVPVLVPADCALADAVPSSGPGAVGLSYGSPAAAVQAMDELIERWPLYKANAVAASAGFRKANSPGAVLAMLVRRAAGQTAAVSAAGTSAPSTTS